MHCSLKNASLRVEVNWESVMGPLTYFRRSPEPTPDQAK